MSIKTDVSIASLVSGKSSASWVIVRSSTGEVLFETFNPSIISKINTKAYKVVPIIEYLQALNANSVRA